jgi:hypothetical protein
VSVEVQDLTDGELHDAVVSVQREIDLLCARQAELVSRWQTRRVWERDGSRSGAHCLSRVTGVSLSTARRVLLRSSRLASMPLTSSALSSGSLSCDRVDILVRANRPAISDLFSRDEQMLVTKVHETRLFADACSFVDRWGQSVDAEKASRDARHLVEIRSASRSRTLAGSVELRALFDPVGGEIFTTALERIEQTLWKTDQEEGSSRTATQRRCDALVEMATRAGSVPAGSRAPRALFSVLVDYETFAGAICETASGTVLSPDLLVPHLTTADIERIVFDGPSRVIDVGHKRLFTGALRRAIEVRDRHCQDDSGCDVPAERCDVDHVVAATAGGSTTQDNGQLMCGKHNRRKWDLEGNTKTRRRKKRTKKTRPTNTTPPRTPRPEVPEPLATPGPEPSTPATPGPGAGPVASPDAEGPNRDGRAPATPATPGPIADSEPIADVGPEPEVGPKSEVGPEPDVDGGPHEDGNGSDEGRGPSP